MHCFLQSYNHFIITIFPKYFIIIQPKSFYSHTLSNYYYKKYVFIYLFSYLNYFQLATYSKSTIEEYFSLYFLSQLIFHLFFAHFEGFFARNHPYFFVFWNAIFVEKIFTNRQCLFYSNQSYYHLLRYPNGLSYVYAAVSLMIFL